jgi:hypothetical protein
MNFEDFHIVAVKETSDRIAALLSHAGIRIQQRAITEIGRLEYVIAVHPDDLERAEQVFSSDIAPGRTFTSEDT